MGHYYSEMISDEQVKREADAKNAAREATAKAIAAAIEKEGVAYVLADIIMDPIIARIRYRKW